MKFLLILVISQGFCAEYNMAARQVQHSSQAKKRTFSASQWTHDKDETNRAKIYSKPGTEAVNQGTMVTLRKQVEKTKQSAQKVDDPSVSEPARKRARLEENGESDLSPEELNVRHKKGTYEDFGIAYCVDKRSDTTNDCLESVNISDPLGVEAGCQEIQEMHAQGSEMKEQQPTKHVAGGDYERNYHTLKSIGKGAFGFVKLATRKADKQEVVVKFIIRAKVLRNCWVDDKALGPVPLEVAQLGRLNHPNIVKMVDFYQNAEFLQMVMEKHGNCMDLFEYVARKPKDDERLCSYIFRQVVSAVGYLHARNIVHLDIKPENIIINQQFQVKLIDFGCAAILQPGKEFETFCGSMPYCSPEVLRGNKYKGPELDLWSLGVTLYTLVFGENPFYDVEETIRCQLRLPDPVSDDLFHVLHCLLNPIVEERATIVDIQRDTWVWQYIELSQYLWEEVLPNC